MNFENKLTGKRKSASRKRRQIPALVCSLIIVLASLTQGSRVRAQISQSYYGATPTEVALDVKALDDGSTIMVGYTAPNFGNTNDKDALIVKTAANHQVVWSRKLHTSNNDVLHRVIVTENGDYIAVGYMDYTGTEATPAGALIVKYNSAGSLLWSYQITDTNPFDGVSTTVGDLFYDVRELASGNIIAVGVRDVRGGTGNGMACMFNASGAILWKKVFYKTSNSDEIYWVNELSNHTIIMGGVYQGGSYSDGTIINIDQSGTLIKSYGYDFTLTSPNGTSLTSNDPRVSFVFAGDQLVIGGHASENYSVGNGTNPFILRFNYSTNLTAVNTSLLLKGVRTPPYNYSNMEKIFALDPNDIVLSQNPSNTLLSLNASYPFLNLDGHITRINFNASSVNYSKKISLNGNQSILGLDVKNNTVYGAGSAIDDAANQFGNHDIYQVESDLSFTKNGNCEVVDTAAVLYNVPCQMVILKMMDSVINPNVQMPGDQALSIEYKNICHSDETGGEGCDDKCYWTVDGNTVASSAKFLGTKNNMSLKLRTNNVQRAVLSTSGDLGINTATPTAKLHVECSNPANGSNVRFENLTWGYGATLVIDANGYVYKKEGDDPGISEMKQQLEQLKKEISTLKEQLNNQSVPAGSADRSTDGARIITAAPNPARGYVEIEYYTPANASKCYLQVQDISGRIIKTLSLDTPGPGKATIQLGEVAPQQLIVALYVDGHMADTRKVIKN
jgi:hypothetical protein